MTRTQCSRFFQLPRELVHPKILPGEQETERAKGFFGDGLEWTEVCHRVEALGVEVHPWSNWIEVSGDGFSSDMENPLPSCCRLVAAGHILLRVLLL